MNPLWKSWLEKKDLTDKEWEKQKKINEKKRKKQMVKDEKKRKKQGEQDKKDILEDHDNICPHCGHDKRTGDTANDEAESGYVPYDPDMEDGSDWEQEHSRD